MTEQMSVWDEATSHIPNTWEELAFTAPTEQIQSAFAKAYTKFRELNGDPGPYERIMVSVSGGWDSDVMLDMIERIGYAPGTVRYVFFDTGIEFKATKDHLDELEAKYGIKIERIPAKMACAAAVKKYGVPFLSKNISEYIHRLQMHNFKWEDKSFEELYAEYPNCKAALRWWCNRWGEGSQKNISRRAYLKEFMISNPPPVPISNMCCQKSKKDTAAERAKTYNPDLDCQGVRKAEGGQRATAYSGCFDENVGEADKFRPIYWFSDADKLAYTATYGVCRSRCYTKYGLKRTGCACCPFGRDFEHELEAAKEHEPALYTVALAIFGKSYEYTRKYKAFRDEMKAREKAEETPELFKEAADA